MKIRSKTLALVLLLAAGGIQAADGRFGLRQVSSQVPGIQFPDTPAGKAAAAYFEAFNAGEQAMKDYWEKFGAQSFLQRIPMQSRLERDRQVRGQLGRLAPQRIVESRADSLSVVAQNQAGQFVRLDFRFEDTEPFGLLGIRILPVGGPADEGPRPDPKKDDDELFAAVRISPARPSRPGISPASSSSPGTGCPFLRRLSAMPIGKKRS